jgi:hypothetical protein
LTPSPADSHSISHGGAHVIYTRYVHRGGGKIANPIAGETAERVAMHMAGNKVVRFNSRTKEYWYQVSLQIKDGLGNTLWSGEVYSKWSAVMKTGSLSFTKPPELGRALPSGWQVP